MTETTDSPIIVELTRMAGDLASLAEKLIAEGDVELSIRAAMEAAKHLQAARALKELGI